MLEIALFTMIIMMWHIKSTTVLYITTSARFTSRGCPAAKMLLPDIRHESIGICLNLFLVVVTTIPALASGIVVTTTKNKFQQ